MFDPTAFENMKTVFEGAAYELDLRGEASITGRKDLVDLAEMSREYRITLQLPEWQEASVTICLSASLGQLAAEILDLASGAKAGASAAVTFSWKNRDRSADYKQIILSAWGNGNRRRIEERTVRSSRSGVTEEVAIDFARLITEDLMDDLLKMPSDAVKTLHRMRV